MKTPLAEQLRPKNLEEFFGQAHIVGKEGWLSKVIESGRPLSVLFWGPPGCGKTTMAKLYMQAFSAQKMSFHPASHGIADLKKLIKDAQDSPLFYKQLIVFVDEIHRWNKAQQDAFLPYMEDGTLVLVGATTENPSFALNSALLSRLRVINFTALDDATLECILEKSQSKIKKLHFTEEAKQTIIRSAAGDGRYLLNMIENLLSLNENEIIDNAKLQHYLQKRAPLYDRGQDQHYNLISALHKCIRGSDPDAALYWLARMLKGGEDPQFLARRLVRMAIEDIGLADPDALQVAKNAAEAYERLGSPEGDLALAEAAVYLALAPKSNALYKAFGKAQELAEETSQLPPPSTILNAPTNLMKNMGYGKDYAYDHDTPHGFSGQHYFPSELERQDFYHPVERGFEREMKKRKDFFAKLRKDLGK